MKNINTPKYIYLDQNKWIELAKGLKNKEIKYTNLYSKIKSNVELNIWAFPLSIIHIAESMKRKDEESRKNLLNLMYSLSKGCSISDYAIANLIEFNYWINNEEFDCKKIQNEIIAYDLTKIVGLSTSKALISINGNSNISGNQVNLIKNFIAKNSCRIEIFDIICNICSSLNEDADFFYNNLEKARNEFTDWKNEIEKSDDYKEKHLYNAYLIKTFFAEYKKMIRNLSLNQRNKLLITFSNNSQNKEKMINLLETLPGFNIYNRLMYEVLSNKHKKVHKHDFFDLAFLRVAVPYCDVVISENYWTDRIQYYKLDKKFNTISTTDLFELEKL